MRRSWHADLGLETLMAQGTTRGTPKTEARHLQQLGSTVGILSSCRIRLISKSYGNQRVVDR